MDNVDANQLFTFTQKLNALRGAPLELNGEPPLWRLYDPPGKTLTHAYLQTLTSAQEKTVLYAEIPPAQQRPSGDAWLCKTLLRQCGDPSWDKREAAYNKESRLKFLLNRRADLMIIADIHLLGTDQKGARYLDWLLSLFQTGASMPLVLMGEKQRMNQLIATDERFIWRFQLIALEESPLR